MEFQEDIKQMKNKKKIVMLTAYDCQTAKILDAVGIDMVLVGDSVGMVFQGCENTKTVTMENMIYHTRAVAQGVKRTPIIGDMPIDTYKTSEIALENAKLFVKSGASAVKIEGNHPSVVKAIVNSGIPVMGHVGMLPQTAGSYRVRGKESIEAETIMQDAQELDQCGVFSVVLECIPEDLAKRVTENVRVPTIGIGAGVYCDGQVLVVNDMLGMSDGFSPKFVKKYADLDNVIRQAVRRFKEDVVSQRYPDAAHTYH